jgi:hypothetical protein
MTESPLFPSPKTVISCETIQIAFSLSDRQTDMSYNLFSTYIACIVFGEKRSIQRHRNLSRVCSVVFKGFLSTKKAFRESNPTPLSTFKRWFNGQWGHLLTVFWYASSLLSHLFKKLLPNVLITEKCFELNIFLWCNNKERFLWKPKRWKQRKRQYKKIGIKFKGRRLK